jgi:hypothetical protein
MDYPSLYSSLTVRTPYQRRDRGLVWPGLAGAVFLPNEPLVDVLACTRVTEDAQGGVQLVASVYGMPQVTASSACSAVSLRQPEGGAEVYGVRTEVVQSSQPVRFDHFHAVHGSLGVVCMI